MKAKWRFRWFAKYKELPLGEQRLDAGHPGSSLFLFRDSARLQGRRQRDRRRSFFFDRGPATVASFRSQKKIVFDGQHFLGIPTPDDELQLDGPSIKFVLAHAGSPDAW